MDTSTILIIYAVSAVIVLLQIAFDSKDVVPKFLSAIFSFVPVINTFLAILILVSVLPEVIDDLTDF